MDNALLNKEQLIDLIVDTMKYHMSNGNPAHKLQISDSAIRNSLDSRSEEYVFNMCCYLLRKQIELANFIGDKSPESYLQFLSKTQ